MDITNSKPSFIYHSKERIGVRRHTLVGIINDEKMYIGHAACNDSDTFQRKLGVKIASGRALKDEKALHTIDTLKRSKMELKVLFKDICDNFIKVHPNIARPQHLRKNKLRLMR